MEKECKIVCNEKEIATIKRSEDGFSVKCAEEGKSICKDFCGGGCC